MSNLPQHWVVTNFGSICGSGQYGWTARATNKGSVRFLRTTDITKGQIDWDSVPYCQDNPSDLDKYQIQANDILISRAGSVGFSTLIKNVPFPTVFASYLIRFVPSNNIEPRYIAYFLQSAEYWQQISEASAGIAVSNVNAKKLSAISIPLAPLNEQKRIADKLDSLFARVDACRDRLERVSHILERFRQSVITAAISGELTDDWVNTNNSEAWQEAVIGDLLIEKPRNGYSPRAVNFETDTRSLTLTATTSGKFNPTHIKYINEKIPEDSYLWLKPNDILIQRANTLEYVGVSAIYEGLPKQYIYPDLIMKCRANDRVLTKFLYYLLSSHYVRSYFRKYATGTSGNMPKINQKTVVSAPVSVPSIDEQQEIVGRVDRLFAYADRLEVCYRQACTKVEKLTTTLLDKAFRGELVPQDPNDEPATVLLERIRAKRSEQAAQPKRTFKRKLTMEINEASVKEVIDQWPQDTFSFEELYEKISGNYDSLKDILFSLLSEPKPIITQIFDPKAKSIRFVRGNQ